MGNFTSPVSPGSKASGAPSARFRPSEHGFRFANRFPGVPLPFTLPSAIRQPSTTYGLCGGMCFAAADFFQVRKPVPQSSQVPSDDTPLYRYLLRRQLDSFGSASRFVLKFIAWMFMPDGTVNGTQRRTAGSLEAVRLFLDAGQVAILGLVYVKGQQSLAVWQNHQVMAYGYQVISETKTDVSIYDPNYPGNDGVFIRCEQVEVGRKKSKEGKNIPIYGVACTEVIPGAPDRAVRGFFPIAYTPQEPPDL